MRGDDLQQAGMFSTVAEQRVPRTIRWLDPQMPMPCCGTVAAVQQNVWRDGSASIARKVLRALLLQCSTGAQRATAMEELNYNLCFAGRRSDMDDWVWDPTTSQKNRKRLFGWRHRCRKSSRGVGAGPRVRVAQR